MTLSRLAFCCAVLFLSIICLGQKTSKSSSGDPAIGRWKLNAAKSRFLDPKDKLSSMVRSYERDGEKTKVTWQGRAVSGKSTRGSYSAKCDGTSEDLGNGVQITCQRVGRRRVDGEVVDPADPDHRYFTRQVAADGQSMNLIWYKDADRKQVRDVLLFAREVK